MKFDLLATKDEIIVRDLFPIVVSNRRVYVCSGSRTRYSRSYVKRIIEIESITSVRFQLTKNPFLKFMAFLCLIISILGASLAVYSYITTKSFTGDLFLYGAIGFGVGLLLFILFLIAYLKKRKKIIWIEYPSNFAQVENFRFYRWAYATRIRKQYPTYGSGIYGFFCMRSHGGYGDLGY